MFSDIFTPKAVMKKAKPLEYKYVIVSEIPLIIKTEQDFYIYAQSLKDLNLRRRYLHMINTTYGRVTNQL